MKKLIHENCVGKLATGLAMVDKNTRICVKCGQQPPSDSFIRLRGAVLKKRRGMWRLPEKKEWGSGYPYGVRV